MTRIEDREQVRERLLDAALTEMFADGEEAVAVAEAPPVAGPRRLLLAAVMLVGVGVVGAVGWLSRECGGADQVATTSSQDPASQDAGPVVEADEDTLEDVPDSVQNLTVRFKTTFTFPPLQRFRQLRRLNVSVSMTPQGLTDCELDVPDFEGLAGLPQLEYLRVVSRQQVTVGCLQALAAAPKLRALVLGAPIEMAPGFAAALGALSRLERLELSMCPVDAEVLGALPRGMRHLSLFACPGMDDAAYAELAKLEQLRWLVLTNQNSETKGRRDLGEAAFDAFAALPELRDLFLDECAFEDRFVAKLPVGLERLDLGWHKMTPSTIRDLKRLANLRDLTFHHNTCYEECADLLVALPLENVCLHGWLDDRVIAALGRHPTLRTVDLNLRADVDLTPLAEAPRLERVKLRLQSPAKIVTYRAAVRAREKLVARGLEVEVEVDE